MDKNLLFRRQFLITPDICPFFSHWQHMHICNYHVYAHPDLQLSTVTSADAKVTLTLLGFIIDPDYPGKSNTDVLNMIAHFADSIEKITEYLRFVSGRFVLKIDTPRETLLFHDPCGLRSVYYTKYKGKIFVGSQPLIFKQILPLQDGERLSSYISSLYVKTHIEHWIPSGCSLFEEVYHLVPNHYLRFSTLEQIRYWPKKILPQKRVNEVVDEASDLLKRLMISGNNRFKLALALTGGWDSRILLSASKSISKAIYFFTLQYRSLHPKSNDIKIPGELLQSLGLSHSLIDCRKIIPEAFREIYQQNSSPSHMKDWGEIAYGMLGTYPQERVCVKGNCAEIARCGYYYEGNHQPFISPDQIIALEDGWHTIPFVHDQISTWYDQASKAAAEANIDILDLFYWEHRMGSWQAQSQLEWDIIQDEFTPFNHRGLLEVLLCTPAKLRCEPNYSLYKRIMKVLWPEVMRYPVNPAKTPKMVLKNILFTFGIEARTIGFYRQVLGNNYNMNLNTQESPAMLYTSQ
jgi:hypothetical protein